jgi:hypothetical protein
MAKTAIKVTAAEPSFTEQIDVLREKLQAELDRRVEHQRKGCPGVPRGAVELCLTRGSWCLCSVIRELEEKDKKQ